VFVATEIKAGQWDGKIFPQIKKPSEMDHVSTDLSLIIAIESLY
jgi:hypothetical protein